MLQTRKFNLEPLETNNNPQEQKNQVLVGNRCNHNSKNPTTYSKIRKNKKKRPHSIEQFHRETVIYFNKPKQLNCVDKLPLAEFTHHPRNEKGKRRYKRSEAREAEFLVMGAIADNLHLQNMTCGFYDNFNNFHYYDCGFLREATGLHPDRISRAIRSLKRKGHITIKQIVQRLDDGHIINKEVHIEVSDSIFDIFGLKTQLLKDRESVKRGWHRREKQKEDRELFSASNKPTKKTFSRNETRHITEALVKRASNHDDKGFYRSSTPNPANQRESFIEEMIQKQMKAHEKPPPS